MKTSSAKQLFDDEFAFLAAKFEIYELPLSQAELSQEPHIWKPGVYVFWHPENGVIKVGRHLINSRKRALEHIQPNINTGGIMAALREDPEVMLSLFNVKDSSDRHWVAALEIFFEEQLSPKVKAARLG